jgi:aminotransferase EvaB
MTIAFSYLRQQFADADAILGKIGEVVASGDFTLGEELAKFETEFAARCGAAHAIGVNSGTDALFLALKALGVDGGEIITTPYSFYATAAAIVHAGAKPVFVDVGLDFNIDPALIERAITKKTRAIIPVHGAGRPCDMAAICEIAKARKILVIEDAAQAFGSSWDGRHCGTWGNAGAFSLHPLKTLNIWGDGGVIVTDDAELARTLRSMRNHGLQDRDTCVFWGWNSRLDTIQAVVARHVLTKFSTILSARIRNAGRFDSLLAGIDGIDWTPLPTQARSNYYLYTVRARHRDALVAHLTREGIEAKVHYPVPLHLQPAARSLGHRRGDFPVAERLADETVSLPAHDHLTGGDFRRMAAAIAEFYGALKQGVREQRGVIGDESHEWTA